MLDEQDPSSKRGRTKFLTFVVGAESYGLPIEHVTEIIRVQDVTPIPDVPSFIQGIINLRGKVIPIMDMRLRLGMPTREPDSRTCVVVVQLETTFVGLMVDAVCEVSDIENNHISPAPAADLAKQSIVIEEVAKIGEEIKLLVNVKRLLFAERMQRAA